VSEDQVDEVSLDLGWIPLGSRPASDTSPYERVWLDEVAEVYVHYVWDDLLALAFLLLQGRDVRTVEQEIQAALPIHTYDEVLAELRSASGREAVIDAIARLAALRPSEDAGVAELLRGMANDDDPEIRRAVVTAAGYLEWPALLALLTRLREDDADQTVRDEAATVLDAIASSRRDQRD
jgi:hypothetical protein